MDIINSSGNLSNNFNKLTVIPGIEETTAIAVLAEIQDVLKFKNARQLAVYIGVTPQHKNSGTSVKAKPSIAKIGNSILRKALYLPATTAIRCNKVFAEFVNLVRQREKNWIRHFYCQLIKVAKNLGVDVVIRSIAHF